jgi:iron complex outermembrane recepter protein
MKIQTFLLAGVSLYSLLCCGPAQAQATGDNPANGGSAQTQEVSAAQETRDPPQDDSDNQGDPDEIVVTANKSGAARLQDVPISIGVISGETLANANIQEFEDYAHLVSGVSFKDLGPGEKTIVTRGLVSTGAATTAVYFGETNVTAFNDGEGGGRNLDLKLFDLERIEVLRGPQGTQYGASALGGVVRLIPAKPNLRRVKAGVDGEFSSTRFGGSNYQINGFLDVPLIEDVLGVRFVGWQVNNSGYIENVRLHNEDINDENTYGGRVTVLFKPTDKLRITGLAILQNQKIGDGSRYNPKGSLGLSFPGDPDVIVDDDLQVTDFTVNNRSDRPRIFSLTGEYDLGWGDVVATTNLYKRKILFNFDSTPILLFFGVPIKAVSSLPEDRRIWSNEVRFNSHFDGPIQILTGAYYQKEKLDTASSVFTVDDNGEINEPSPSVLHVVRNEEVDEKAVFGELTYTITPKWKATVGGRYAKFSFVTDENALVPFFAPPTGPKPTRRGNDDAFTMKFNTSYAISDDQSIYATASQGFRRGGLNLNAFDTVFTVPETFGSDKLWNYEVGAKTSWFNNRLTVNAALYTIRWSDMQLETVSSQGSIEYFTNAGKATIDGLELELTGRPTRELELNASLGYTNARLTEDAPPIHNPPSPDEGRDGDHINNVPKWTGSISVQYTKPLTDTLSGLARADFSYTDGSNTKIAGERDPFNVTLKSYALLNLKLGVESDRWRAELFADNVFDKRTQNDAINEVTNILAFVTTRPRTIGMRAGYNF